MAEKQYLLAEATIDAGDIADLIAWLKTNPRLTQGPLVREFEQAWARRLGRRFAVLVNSGSSANLLMYYALLLSGRLKNRKVIVPAVSWPTTVAPAIQLGCEPIMCDADEETFGLDPDYLETLLKKHDPASVILVHVLGVPAKMDEILALKERYNFFLMEDACAALGSRYGRRLAGTFGELASFSFYYGHHISTIEGGMIVTDDNALAELLVQARAHGWAKDLLPEQEARLAAEHNVIPFNRRFTFYYPGFNFRSTDLNARLGLSQLKKLEAVTERRIRNHHIYQSRFSAGSGFHIQKNDRALISSISFAALASSQEHRERIGQVLAAKRIETRPLGGGNMSRQPFWKERYGAEVFPVADRIHTTAFHLPNHHLLGPEEINYISDVVLQIPAEAEAI